MKWRNRVDGGEGGLFNVNGEREERKGSFAAEGRQKTAGKAATEEEERAGNVRGERRAGRQPPGRCMYTRLVFSRERLNKVSEKKKRREPPALPHF